MILPVIVFEILRRSLIWRRVRRSVYILYSKTTGVDGKPAALTPRSRGRPRGRARCPRGASAAASAAGRATSHPTYVHSTYHAAAAAAADDADYDGATADNDDDAHTRVARVRFPGKSVAADAAA